MKTPLSSQAPDFTLTFSCMVASDWSFLLQITMLCFAISATWVMSADQITYLTLAIFTEARDLNQTRNNYKKEIVEYFKINTNMKLYLVCVKITYHLYFYDTGNVDIK